MGRLLSKDTLALSLLEELKAHAEALVALANNGIMTSSAGLHAVIAGMHAVSLAANRCAVAGMDREAMTPSLESLRDVCMGSPFVSHITHWPRGYPGDFEAIECVMSQLNKAPFGTLQYWIEEYCLCCGMAQQHRNKVLRQASVIRESAIVSNRAGKAVNIAVLACGSSPDLVLVQQDLAELPVRITLLDADEEAIQMSLSKLPLLAGRITALKGNVVRRIRDLARQERFDLVVAGGLFDYLPDQIAQFVIAGVGQKLLKRGGAFFFTNMGPENPYEDWTRYVANWSLIHRSESDLDRLIEASLGHTASAQYERDQTGLAILATVVIS